MELLQLTHFSLLVLPSILNYFGDQMRPQRPKKNSKPRCNEMWYYFSNIFTHRKKQFKSKGVFLHFWIIWQSMSLKSTAHKKWILNWSLFTIIKYTQQWTKKATHFFINFHISWLKIEVISFEFWINRWRNVCEVPFSPNLL